MDEIFDRMREWDYLPQFAFLVAVLLFIMAWKFGIEGILD